MRTLSILFFSLLFMQSCMLDDCRTKNTFLNSHEKFVTQTMEKKEDWSDEQWESKDEEFERYLEECYEKYKEDLTEREKKAFWKSSGKYIAHRFKHELTNNIVFDEDQIQEFKEAFEDVGADLADTFHEVFDEDFAESMKDFKNELREVFDEDFKNEIKEIFDEDFKKDLKEAMNELKEGLLELKEELKDLEVEEN